MLINLGRPLMLCVWAFLLLNIFQPFPHPPNIFANVALIFMMPMHGVQLALPKSTVSKDGPQMTNGGEIHVFLFDIFELLVWQEKTGDQLRKQLWSFHPAVRCGPGQTCNSPSRW